MSNYLYIILIFFDLIKKTGAYFSTFSYNSPNKNQKSRLLLIKAKEPMKYMNINRYNFLQWFTSEQYEEEALFKRIKMTKKNLAAILANDVKKENLSLVDLHKTRELLMDVGAMLLDVRHAHAD